MAFEVQHQVELPTGELLQARLKDLEVKEIPKRDGSGTFQKLKWVFEITQAGDYYGKTVFQETSAYLSDSPYNTFRLWAEALLQRPLDLGQVLNESDLIGLPALITVKYEEDYKDSTKKWARVEDVIAASPGALQPPF